MGSWESRVRHPEEGVGFDADMSGNTRQQSAALLAALDVAPASCVVDVGGGQGAFLAALLAAHPTARGAVR
jgi:predicted methyltransferase